MAQEGNLAVAIQDFKTALQALPLDKRISKGDTEAIYSLAYNFILQGHYESAFRYFSLLTVYRPTDTTYLTGLAISYKLLGRLREAEAVYNWLAVIDPDEPAHTLGLAEVQLLQHEHASARESLDLVIGFCREKGGYDRIRTRSEALRSLIDPGASSARH